MKEILITASAILALMGIIRITIGIVGLIAEKLKDK